MNGYEILGKAVVNGIIYILSSAFLGMIMCCVFTTDYMGGADLDEFPKYAWIGGCIVCIVMILRCGYY